MPPFHDWFFLYSDTLHTLPFNAILSSSDGSCTIAIFSTFCFLLQLVFYLIKVCCLSPLLYGSDCSALHLKCLLNNVGLVKAQSSFLLALSRYVLIIKHVSVSTRLLPAFLTHLVASAVFMEATFSCHHVGWWGNYIKTRFRQLSKATEFCHIKHIKQCIFHISFISHPAI